MFYTIYKITNLVNNKIYIGAHGTNDLNDNYMGSGKILNKAKKKHGIDNFVKETLFIFNNVDDMYLKEREIVDEVFIKQNNTYNIKPGGIGNAPGFSTFYNTITEEYETAHKEDSRILNGILISNTAGKTTVIKNGKYYSMNISEFKSDDIAVGVCKNKIPVFLKDADDKCVQIDLEEYTNNKHLYTPAINKNGTISVIDEYGVKRRVSKEMYDADESLISISKGTVTAKNIITGEIVKLSKELFDSSGIYVGITKGQSNSKYCCQIYNNLGELVYDNITNLYKFIINNKLPSVFIKSQRKNGEPIYKKLGSNESRLRENNMLQYVGWYCIKIKKESNDK